MISYDAGAASYDLLSGRWSRLYIPTLLAQAGIAVGQWVLDVATGTGEAVILAASRVGARGKVIGIDVAPDGVAAAKYPGGAYCLTADGCMAPSRTRVLTRW